MLFNILIMCKRCKMMVFLFVKSEKDRNFLVCEVESDIECYANTPVLYSLSSN